MKVAVAMEVAMVAEAAAVVAEPTDYARILDETKELWSKSWVMY